MENPCGCGCGETANAGKGWVNGHQRRGIAHTEETRRKMRAGMASRTYAAKRCVICGTEFTPDHPRRTTCSKQCKRRDKRRVFCEWQSTEAGRESLEKSTTARRQTYKADPQHVRDGVLRSKYGITRVQWEALLARQTGVCAICASPLSRGRGTHVDHDHATGNIRGLLCNHCNVAIGMLKDSPALMRAAAAYVEHHSKTTNAQEP